MLSLLSLGPDFNLFWSQIFYQKCKEQSSELRQSRLCTFLWHMCYFTFNTLCRPQVLWFRIIRKHAPCADLESSVRAINLESFVTNINGPSSARQRNAIEMAFCWRADDAGDPDQYCEETLHFCAFSGGGGWSWPPTPRPPPRIRTCAPK